MYMCLFCFCLCMWERESMRMNTFSFLAMKPPNVPSKTYPPFIISRKNSILFATMFCNFTLRLLRWLRVFLKKKSHWNKLYSESVCVCLVCVSEREKWKKDKKRGIKKATYYFWIWREVIHSHPWVTLYCFLSLTQINNIHKASLLKQINKQTMKKEIEKKWYESWEMRE